RRHCAPPDPRFRGLMLRLFVDRSDAVTVTTRPVLRQYPDGTGVYLTEGVMVSAPKPYPWVNGLDVRTVRVDGLSLDLDLPRADTGTSYVLSHRSESADGAEIIDARAPLTLGGTGRVLLEGSPSVHAAWPRADGLLIEVR